MVVTFITPVAGLIWHLNDLILTSVHECEICFSKRKFLGLFSCTMTTVWNRHSKLPDNKFKNETPAPYFQPFFIQQFDCCMTIRSHTV